MTGPEVLRGIANDIERQGHFRGPNSKLDPMSYSQLYDPRTRKNGRCCLIANPTNHKRAQLSEFNQVGWRYRLQRALGLMRADRDMTAWSDNTSTEQVLMTLRRVADEWEAEEKADG